VNEEASLDLERTDSYVRRAEKDTVDLEPPDVYLHFLKKRP